ncbi:helix-turn-helix domain-containing protein [Frisingicoccus sp.]|uniref:helix-turn-helix domain-containing protein n=1 Tax=Frisingicoccus sp. TaxID=1918627 RepID=UPI003AB3F381
MPKFNVTQNMGAALRNLRIRQNVKAIDVAKAINKTGAYISKLEKGTLNTISEEDLITIINTLSTTQEDFYKNIELLLSDTSMEYSEEESQNEEWKLNLELFYQRFSVPEEYITIAKKKMNELSISIKELTDYINSNFDLYNDERLSKEDLDNAEKNHWYFNNGTSFIVVHMDESDIYKVLNGKDISTNYSMLLCILVSLLRLEKTPYNEAYSIARKTLADLKILTLSEKEAIMQAYDQRDKMHSIIDQRNNENLPEADRKLLNSLYTFIEKTNSFAQIHSINYVNERMDSMIENLTNDPILFMGYIGVDLSKLKDCDIKLKREFVNAIKELINEYSIKTPKNDQELI